MNKRNKRGFTQTKMKYKFNSQLRREQSNKNGSGRPGCKRNYVKITK